MPRRRSFGPLELTGRTRAHLIELGDIPGFVHRDVRKPFLAMRAAARRSGIDLVPASSFRDFEAQVRIWNDKWLGRRALIDRAGRTLIAGQLRPAARVAAILAWSAPPGASRHHWGTELDVFDRAAVPRDYRLQLVSEEYSAAGPFARLSAWLDRNMARFDFYRPYARDLGGVAPEPWHLSHAPTAREASLRLRPATVRAAIESAPIEGRAALLRELPRIYARYVRAVEPPPR